MNREQLDGKNDLNVRRERWLFMVLGHLKKGVTPAQAIADLNSIGSSLEKSYPKDAANMSFTLARPFLYGDEVGGPIKAFMMGLMMLAGLILLAACANLGIFFSSRAADRSAKLLCGWRWDRVADTFPATVSGSPVDLSRGRRGRTIDQLSLLRGLDVWQPFARFPVHLAVHPGANIYVLALVLTLVSRFFFGAVAIRPVMRTNPYVVIKSGATARPGRRVTFRDLLLVAQIAICAGVGHFLDGCRAWAGSFAEQ